MERIERAVPSLLAKRGEPGIIRFVRRKPLGALGFALLLALILFAALAQVAAPADPYKIRIAERFIAPGSTHWMGTDNYGRDILSRLMYGGQISLFIAITAIAIGDSLGFALGVASGYFRGKVDLFVQRFADILMAFPNIVLAIALISALGPSIGSVIIAIAFTGMGATIRVTRSSALSIMGKQYMEAARALGVSHWRGLVVHLVPNCLAPLIILVSADLGRAILVEATLGFLGLSVPPPVPTWGNMLSGGARTFFETAPWMPIFPGLVISLAVFGINLWGDALRDVLDPRLRGR